uniref:Secreted protein n=1 Tax=Steinernema glaseri TaxID=37863 RepID=A0A1I7ZTC8_9BILA
MRLASKHVLSYLLHVSAIMFANVSRAATAPYTIQRRNQFSLTNTKFARRRDSQHDGMFDIQTKNVRETQDHALLFAPRAVFLPPRGRAIIWHCSVQAFLQPVWAASGLAYAAACASP